MHRRLGRFGEAAEPFHGRDRAVRGMCGNSPSGCAPARPAVGARSPRPCLLLSAMKLATCSRTAANGFERLVGVDRRVLRAPCSRSARIESTLSSSCSAGLARRIDRAEVAAAVHQAGPEFVDDEREALRVRAAAGCRRAGPSRRGWGVRDRQEVLAGAFVAGAGSSSAAAAAACLPPAAGWVRSRRTSRRSAPAGGSCSWRRWRKSWKPGLPMLRTTAAFALRRRFDRFDGADLDAVDLDVLAGDDVAGVVEDRAHGVAAVRPPPAELGQQHDRDERGEPASARHPGYRPPAPDPPVPHPILPCRSHKGRPRSWWGRPCCFSLLPRAYALARPKRRAAGCFLLAGLGQGDL